MKVLFPRTFNGMERSYTNSETTARLARAFGIETDVDDYVVHLKSRPGFMEVTVAAKYRMAELKLYHSFGKTVVRETNTNVGLQICTTWDRTTNELSHQRGHESGDAGVPGERPVLCLRQLESRLQANRRHRQTHDDHAVSVGADDCRFMDAVIIR